MKVSDKRFFNLQRLNPVIALILFAAALWVLHDALHQVHYHHLLTQIRNIPAAHILSALGLTVISYTVMTGYDLLAIKYIRHSLDKRKVILASFISYAFSNTIGLSLLTSTSIRYRLYSTWGLSTEEIARLVAFTVLTFWMGMVTVSGLVFIIEPAAIPVMGPLAAYTVRPIGIILTVMVFTYTLAVFFRKEPLTFKNWEIQLPSIPLTLTQLLVGTVDWALAGWVLFVLLPEQVEFSFVQFLGIFVLAQIVALISHVPGGLGVFESMMLLSAPDIPADQLLSSMIIYRGIYYLSPLALAVLLLAANELLERKGLVRKAWQQVDRWWGIMIPPLLAATTFVSGAILLFSGATPTIPGRLHWLYEILPLPVIEISHFLGSLIGVCLLLLARGLQRRIDAAYVLTVVFLGIGIILSLLKGVDYEEAIVLGIMLLALLPCRKYFYRRASLFHDSLSLGWSIMIVLVLASSIWLGIFAYKHVDYSNRLWWQFALEGDAPRFLRAAVGSTVLLLILTLTRLLGPPPKNPGRPESDELENIFITSRAYASTNKNLIRSGSPATLSAQAAF